MHAVKSKPSVLAGTDQPVSFAELFFDLVFVYAITQVVHLFHGEFDWTHAGRAILVFWLVWWAWTQFTWALNAADTTHRLVQLWTLIATAIAFFMAVSVPEAFGKSAQWFAIAYVGVRAIGLAIYLWVTSTDPQMKKAVKAFTTFSLAGLLVVLAGGFLSGPLQYVCWGAAIVLDVMAAILGGKNESWKLHANHFAERHGLFVIIALGETLIIAASAVSEEYWNGDLLIVSFLSVGITCCFWWLYFYRSKSILEHAVAMRQGSDRSEMARDVFSLLHFPLLCGLIIYAFAIEEAMTHPHDELTYAARIALALGVFIFSSGIIVCVWRATGRFQIVKLLTTILISISIASISGLATIMTLGIALLGLIILCSLEKKVFDLGMKNFNH